MQMTLNMFHYTGVSSKNVTLGVPRLKEIINVVTNIKTSSSMYLEPDIAQDRSMAKNLQQELVFTSLRTVTTAVHQFTHSAALLCKVKEVQFGILSPEEIVHMYLLSAEGQLTVVAESVLGRKD